MEKYNYRQAIINDIKKYIIENNWVKNNYSDEVDYEDMLDKL